jgi:hypothetical protein
MGESAKLPEIAAMQKTPLPRAVPDPRSSATFSIAPSLCKNHLTSAWLDYDAAELSEKPIGARSGYASTRPGHKAGYPLLAAFLNGLGKVGYTEGQNVGIEYPWAEGHNDRLAALAANLVN